MIVSHFLFRRGTELFEVFVAKKWDTGVFDSLKMHSRQATKLFLEEDDFAAGSDVFALDFLLMQKTHEHLDGKDLFADYQVDAKSLRLGLEGEVRRLAAKTRAAHFRKEQLPGLAALNTLQGIADGLAHLGLADPLPEAITKLFSSDLRAALIPRRRTEPLLTLLQQWEEFLQA